MPKDLIPLISALMALAGSALVILFVSGFKIHQGMEPVLFVLASALAISYMILNWKLQTIIGIVGFVTWLMIAIICADRLWDII